MHGLSEGFSPQQDRRAWSIFRVFAQPLLRSMTFPAFIEAFVYAVFGRESERRYERFCAVMDPQRL